MLGKIRYLISIILAMMLVMAPGVSTAQNSGAIESESPEGGGRGESIAFEPSEDASLFVGYYRLNPGDMIRVEIITDSTLIRDTMIDDEGCIVLPVIGPVRVADMTITEARDEIQKHADIYYRQAWVTCRILQLGKVKFYVYGDFEVPGFYTANGATTFFDFLQRFELASMTDHRRIVHVRGQPQTLLPEPRNLIGNDTEPSSYLIRQSLELFEAGEIDKIDERVTIIDPLVFTVEGQIEQRNFYLEYGDIIHFPDPEVLVTIQGFRRSGDYEVLPGETWADLMKMAGYPEQGTDVSSLILERHDNSGKLRQLYYNLNRLNEVELAQIPIENRDRLIAMEYPANVYVLGAVAAAGAFRYNPALNPMDYLALAGGPTSTAHLRFATIVRTPRDPTSPLTESDLYPVDLAEAITSGAPAADVPMLPGDILFVPDQGEVMTLSNVLQGLSVLINAVRLFE